MRSLAEFDFNSILSRMLKSVPDDLDKREGSVIYSALAPAALALAEQHYMLTQFADMFFADTACRKFRIKKRRSHQGG